MKNTDKELYERIMEISTITFSGRLQEAKRFGDDMTLTFTDDESKESFSFGLGKLESELAGNKIRDDNAWANLKNAEVIFTIKIPFWSFNW